MYPIYSVELEIKLTDQSTNAWKSIIHITKGGSNGVPGDRMPLISLHPNELGIQISSYVNNYVNYAFSPEELLELNIWYKFRIEQILEKGKYIYSIYFKGNLVHTVENTTPIELDNMKVYTNDPWTDTPPTKIRNFIFSTSQCKNLFCKNIDC